MAAFSVRSLYRSAAGELSGMAGLPSACRSVRSVARFGAGLGVVAGLLSSRPVTCVPGTVGGGGLMHHPRGWAAGIVLTGVAGRRWFVEAWETRHLRSGLRWRGSLGGFVDDLVRGGADSRAGLAVVGGQVFYDADGFARGLLGRPGRPDRRFIRGGL
jgi:hypothetical protein